MILEVGNRKRHPGVLQKGSRGESGDLAPVSHLALVLLGEGEVFYKGKRVHEMVALTEEGLEPIELEAKEGLALINGTQAMTAQGVLSYIEAEATAYPAELIASMTIERLQCIIDAFDESVHKARG